MSNLFDVGIRRETMNEWERRAPLAPVQVEHLVREAGLRFAVQPSDLNHRDTEPAEQDADRTRTGARPVPRRAFSDEEYRAAGAIVTDDLSDCRLVLGVKEIPADFFRPGGSYAFFAHVIKGQEYNMPMLRRLMEAGCDLADYELIKDESGRRLVFFGRFAGIAGMGESLVALGRRLEAEGMSNPFAGLGPPHRYADYRELKQAVARLGHQVRRHGLPDRLVPLVIGVAGYGHTGRGAVELLEALPAVRVEPEELPALFSRGSAASVYYTVFREEHMVEPVQGGHGFRLEEYYTDPGSFRPIFEQHLPYLTMLVNCIFWTDRYPRLVTRDWLRSEHGAPDRTRVSRLRVIGDISCDIRGAIEATVRVTDPGRPCYVYDPMQDSATEGVSGPGVVIMAIPNLPCELPGDSSLEFGAALSPFVPALVAGCGSIDRSEAQELPGPLARAFILRRGELTPDYRYLVKYLEQSKG